MKVLSFGEILWDIIEGKAHLGGAPLNFAAHAAQCGADSYMISRLGEDENGKKAFDQVGSLKVSPELIQFDKDRPTGTVDVYLEEGQPSYTIHSQVAYDFIATPEFSSVFDNTDFDIFYFGTLAQRERTSRETLHQILTAKQFKSRFYDVNFRKDCYSKNTVMPSLENSDILKLNDEEVRIISEYLDHKYQGIEEFVKACYNLFGHKVIIITAGDKGCYVYTEEKLHEVPARKVVVADAVGAGDSFSGSFMYMYHKTGDPLKAAYVGNQVGGYVASQHGAIPAYSDEIRDLLKN